MFQEQPQESQHTSLLAQSLLQKGESNQIQFRLQTITSSKFTSHSYQIRIIYHGIDLHISVSTLQDIKLFIQIFQQHFAQLHHSYSPDDLSLFLQYVLANFKTIPPLELRFDTVILSHFIDNQDLISEFIQYLTLSDPTLQPLLIRGNPSFSETHLRQIGLSRLKILELQRTNFTQLNLIAEITDQLTVLNLSFCDKILPTHLTDFFATHCFSNLVTLRLDHTQANEQVFRSFWLNKSNSRIAEIDLNGCRIAKEPLFNQALAEINQKQQSLRSLRLSRSGITEATLIALQWLSELTVLDISHNVRIADLTPLKRDKGFHHLNLSGLRSLSSASVQCALQWETMGNTQLVIQELERELGHIRANCRGLDLSDVKVSSLEVGEGCISLSLNRLIGLAANGLKAWPNQDRFLRLQTLVLANLPISNKFLGDLLERSEQVMVLSLDSLPSITDKALRNLGQLKQIAKLSLRDLNISDISLRPINQKSIRSLSVCGCPFVTVEGAVEMLDRIQIPEDIALLDLRRNNFDYQILGKHVGKFRNARIYLED